MSRAFTPRTRAEAQALKSDEIKRALAEAVLGRPERFEALCAFHSGLPGPKPALPLAMAIGEALAAEPRARALVDRLAANDAAPDTAAVFLPIVAAHVYVCRVRAELRSPGADTRAAWGTLAALAADEREPVRRGTAHALATALDAFGEARAEGMLAERALYLSTVSALATDLADAPRAAERVDARRRALGALGDASARIAASRGEPDGAAWLVAELEKARHPDLRKAFEHTLERLRARGDAQKSETLARLDGALASSKKPPRDPARIREDLRGRGKKHRVRGNR